MNLFVAEPLSPFLTAGFRRLGLKKVTSLEDAQLLFVRSKSHVDRAFLRTAPRLKVIIRAGVGLDHIDQDACRERKIKVTYSPAAASQSVAELTLMLMLEALRFVRMHREAMARGHFRAREVRGFELAGKNVGLVGLGRIGSRVARLLKAFGAEVGAVDPYRSAAYFKRRGVKRYSLASLLSLSDVISLHCPLTDETRDMFDAPSLKRMKKGSFLVNAARGAVVNERAICDALNSKKLSAYAVDVLEQEPPSKNHPLLRHERVLWLPHLGSQTEEAQQRQDEDLLRQVSRLISSH